MRYFVLLSVLAHGVLLALWGAQHAADSTQPALAQNSNTLSIALTAAPTSHNTPSSPAMPSKPQAQLSPMLSLTQTSALKAPAQSPAPVALVAPESPPAELFSTDKPEKPTIIATVANKPKQANNHSTESGSLPPNTAGSRLQQSLTEALASHFHYPRLARKRGWQGTVEIGLNIAINGELSNIRVIQSSGYRVLDRAAINSLKNLGNLTEAKEWLTSDYNGKFPVHYALVDG